ncbi:MAG TPA: hypothetical protein VN681_02040 [Stellaceae bacterium]|nr:hypothetical protein [Stellaceae bacterium]
MRFGSLVLVCVAMLASAVVPASATMRISEDRGGQIGQYLQNYATLRSSGERVVVDGNCLSACTLLLGVIPRDRICATSRARFGFHAAWMPDDNGRPVTSPLGTEALWNIYPTSVRRWINRHGGLTRHMIFMQGTDLHGVVASCDGVRTYQVRAEHRYRDVEHRRPVHVARSYRARSVMRHTHYHRTARYSGAYSASDRR